jgi:hypothetical protein
VSLPRARLGGIEHTPNAGGGATLELAQLPKLAVSNLQQLVEVTAPPDFHKSPVFGLVNLRPRRLAGVDRLKKIQQVRLRALSKAIV